MPDLRFSSFAQPPLGRAIQQTDTGAPLGPATFQPGLTLLHPDGTTSPLTGPALAVLGAGAAVAIEPRAVVRTDPHDGAADVEPNYLASIELTPVELPWLLTPARPGGDPDALRLRPWIALVVVADGDDVLRAGSPLPTITVDVGELPDLADSWAWAHVQQPIPDPSPPPGLPAFDADAVARLVSPRRLEPGDPGDNRPRSWLACVVPTFAGGRAAGLNLPLPADEHAPAWDVAVPGTVQLPVYTSWRFTTGAEGDFETLVRRLAPLDEEHLTGLGVRMVDVSQPWPQDSPLAGTDGPATVPVPGALRSFADVPAGTVTDEALVDLRARLQAELNAPADRLAPEAPVPDTTGAVAPPIYGGRHVPHDRVFAPPLHLPPLAFAMQDWVVQLGFDVAARVAAGIGTAYVRAHQEDLMARAWEQVGAIREANRRRGVGELAVAVAERMHARNVTRLGAGEMVSLAAPASRRTRVTDAGTTLHTEVLVSTLADGAASSAFARFARPGGPVARATRTRAASTVARGLAAQVAVPVPTVLLDRIPAGAGPGTADALGASVVTAVDTAQAGWAAQRLVALQAVTDVARANGLTAQADALQGRLAVMSVDVAAARSGRTNLLQAAAITRLPALATGMAQTVALLQAPQAAGPSRILRTGVQVDVASLGSRLSAALAPRSGIEARIASRSRIPAGVTAAGPVDPVMAYPRFALPASLALLADFPEWFLPGMGAVPPETATLLQPDPIFVESFLVGLAHEFNRELLWREYPTDQRATPFDRFWPRPDGSPDVPPIHTWRGELGLHLDRRASDVVVLLLRGTVVRRFPDLVVAAVPEPTAGDASTWVAPTFSLPVDAQTAAYAFPLRPEVVRGNDPRWFFLLHEHGYRLRFGFDSPSAGDLATWNDLDWSRVPQARGFAVAGLPLDPPGDPGDARWARDATDTARITLQRPFRVMISAHRLVGG